MNLLKYMNMNEEELKEYGERPDIKIQNKWDWIEDGELPPSWDLLFEVMSYDTYDPKNLSITLEYESCLCFNIHKDKLLSAKEVYKTPEKWVDAGGLLPHQFYLFHNETYHYDSLGTALHNKRFHKQ